MISEKKLQEQIALIERVCRETGMTYAEFAELVAASPETVRKWRKGYQPVGERTLQVIAALPQRSDLPARLAWMRGTNPKLKAFKAGMRHQKKTAKKAQELDAIQKRIENAAKRQPPQLLTEQFEYILENSEYGEQAMLRALVEAAYRLVSTRKKRPKGGVRYEPGEE